jgi:AcrR family transcriptional regulator
MGNKERNSYVCNAITDALLEMLKTRDLSEITIGEITEKAQVSRNSFYRNFASKEDIIRQRIMTYLNEWREQTEAEKSEDPKHIYTILFEIAEQHKDFFLLLHDAGLLYLLQDEFFKNFGPADNDNEIAAYSKAFFTYSTYGFLETWIRRGMNRTAKEMEKMLDQGASDKY